MRRALPLISGLIISWAPALASPSTVSGFGDDIDQLETRFFEHTYPADTIEHRLSRLETMVFGETRPGSTQDRITALIMALPPSHDEPAQAAGQSQPAVETAADSDAGDGDSGYQVDEQDSYPHVTALENELVGHTFESLPVTQRLAQLEVKVFGQPSANLDLASRVDNLEQYAQTHLHRRPFAFNPQMAPAQSAPGYGGGQQAYRQAQAPAAPAFDPNTPAPHTGSMLDKVRWMEMKVYAHTFDQDHLLDRLQRLDVAMFPGEPPPHGMKIMDQVDTIMAAVEHSHPARAGAAPQAVATSAAPGDQAADPPPQPEPSHHPIMRDVAKVLGAVGNIAIGSGSGVVGPGPFMGPGMWF